MLSGRVEDSLFAASSPVGVNQSVVPSLKSHRGWKTTDGPTVKACLQGKLR